MWLVIIVIRVYEMVRPIQVEKVNVFFSLTPLYLQFTFIQRSIPLLSFPVCSRTNSRGALFQTQSLFARHQQQKCMLADQNVDQITSQISSAD